MKNKLIFGLTTTILGLATPVIGQTVTSVSAVAPAAQSAPNMLISDVKNGSAKHIEYELEAVAYFLFIPVTGKAVFNIDLDGDFYNMHTLVKTTGVADILVDYDMHVAASGYILDDGLRTYNYISQNNDGKKNRRVELTYGSEDVVMEAKPGFGDLGFPPATPAEKLDANDPITGFIGSAFKPRTGDNPCSETIKLFDGKQLTHMSFEYVGEADVRVKAYKGKAIECHVNVDRVAGYNEGDKGKNLSGIDGPMRMFFAEAFDGFYAPVKLIVETEDIGRITVSAKKLSIRDKE